MISGALAHRYAKALLGLAETEADRDRFGEDLSSIADVLHQVDESGHMVVTILSSNRFPLASRERVLWQLCERVGVAHMVTKFSLHVLRRGRLVGLAEMARMYRVLADEMANRLQATITSATPLSPKALEDITGALERATGKHIIAETAVDPELLGGVVTRLGSFVIDGSVRSTLARLRGSMRS